MNPPWIAFMFTPIRSRNGMSNIFPWRRQPANVAVCPARLARLEGSGSCQEPAGQGDGERRSAAFPLIVSPARLLSPVL